MKSQIFAFFLLTNVAIAGSIEGVPMNCSEKAELRMSKKTSFSMVSACKDRLEPTREHYTFCDGSSCTGFTATLKDNSCNLSDWWDGQDDQDAIEESEWKEGCLTADDFKKPAGKVVVANGKDVEGIATAETYKLTGSVKGLKALDVADLVAKNVRQQRYQSKYSIDSQNLEEVTMSQALRALTKVNGESKALTTKEMNVLSTWNEDQKVSKVYILNLNLSQQGGSGIEQIYIFVPTELYDSVLTITRDVYAE